ncbi:GNAT family N-acetyltransferase [Bacillus sp. 123MFChir2]|uniref:GNAT family N-acetyltransferase n=1 Tax=Bacillus sp. 123MFChir2 TaxID=1169144 RepID=UPI00048BC2D3|nr:GNAT family N-acetyltransferase [Bacillus sp. 123MFChir2]
MMFPILETKRLRLIEINHTYSSKIYDIFSIEEVTRYYGMNCFTKMEQAVRMIDSFAKNFQEKRAIRWGIVVKETGDFVGTVGFNNLQLWSKRAEIGYDIHPAFWRKGYASEAVKEVLAYGFQELDLFRIGAITYPENEASSYLLLKLGFQKEGLLRGYIYQNQHSNDAFVYSILKTDWENR